MYNTAKEAFSPAGPCPASHPVRMPQVAYETLWDTTQFDSMWPKDGSNPFFLSYNDNKGYGTHADYLFGWKDDSLQKAMDSSCMFQACEGGKPLKSQDVAAMNKCAVKSSVNENIDGCEYCGRRRRVCVLMCVQGWRRCRGRCRGCGERRGWGVMEGLGGCCWFIRSLLYVETIQMVVANFKEVLQSLYRGLPCVCSVSLLAPRKPLIIWSTF
tara:strand:- start:5951 stop:6589 length:639 start_codon:yes stop_codon:yes gene_type:complete